MADTSIAKQIKELTASQHEVCQLLEEMAYVQDWQHEPAEWSFRFLAAHLAEVEEECHFPRIVAIASGERPHFGAYYDSGLDFSDRDLAESVRTWIDARRRLLAFVNDLPLERLELAGVHEDLGEVTVIDLLEHMLEQDLGNARHVQQLIKDYYKFKLYSM